MAANIFTKLHRDRMGNEKPVISMDASHLINTLKFFFTKVPAFNRQKAEADWLEGYAVGEMSDKQRRSLGLKKLTPEHRARIESDLDEMAAATVMNAIEKLWPYIVVGVCRDDTRSDVVALLQEVTGITGQIALPAMYRQILPPEASPIVGILGDGTDEVDEDSDPDIMLGNNGEIVERDGRSRLSQLFLRRDPDDDGF